jgi:IS605 OrfB family transposase
MKQTLVIKLAPTKEQHQALLETMERFNEACNYASGKAFETLTFGQYYLHHMVYRYLREHYGLSAQMAVRAIAQVSESYKVDRKVQHSFNPHSTMVYDQRILSWKGLDKVSILTLAGRQIIPTRIGSYQEVRLDRKVRQSDLILRNGIFYLATVVDAPEASPDDPVGTLGVDLGVINLAVDSDGEFYSGESVDKVRNSIDALKASLQSKDTKSAKRHLKRLSGRESRFRRSVNHIISKRLVSKAKDTHCQIALEDLKGVGDSTVRHSQRRRHKSWAFYQLRSFISYKAKIEGVLVKLVDPKNTSRTCPQCGFVSKSNRKSQSLFSCQQCGFASNADIVGATNISHKATVNWPIVSPVLIGGLGRDKLTGFSREWLTAWMRYRKMPISG